MRIGKWTATGGLRKAANLDRRPVFQALRRSFVEGFTAPEKAGAMIWTIYCTPIRHRAVNR
jgi:hypothetical protein